MSIFGFNSVRENAVLNTYQGEPGEGSEICHEAALELSKISAGLLIADVMIESKGVYENADVSVLTEGVIKDTYDKIVEVLKKLWAKIKKWFESVRRALESFFMPIVKFVKKYESEILGKDFSKFEYKGYKWNFGKVTDGTSKVKVDKKVEGATVSMDKILGVYGLNKNSESLSISSDKITSVKQGIIDSVLKEFQTTKTAKNISEMKTIMEKDICGGDEKTTITKFSVVSPGDMIKYILDYKKNIQLITDTQKEVDRSISDTIKDVEALKDKLEADEKAKFGPVISKHVEVLRFTNTVLVAAVEVAASCGKKAYSEFSGVLRSLFRYKPAKEGYGYMDNNSSSILESAMGLI